VCRSPTLGLDLTRAFLGATVQGKLCVFITLEEVIYFHAFFQHHGSGTWRFGFYQRHVTRTHSACFEALPPFITSMLGEAANRGWRRMKRGRRSGAKGEGRRCLFTLPMRWKSGMVHPSSYRLVGSPSPDSSGYLYLCDRCVLMGEARSKYLLGIIKLPALKACLPCPYHAGILRLETLSKTNVCSWRLSA